MFRDFVQIDTSIPIVVGVHVNKVVSKSSDRRTLNNIASQIDERSGFPVNTLGALLSDRTPAEVKDNLHRLIGTQYPDSNQETRGLDDNHILGLTPDYHESAQHYQETVINEVETAHSVNKQKALKKRLQKEANGN